MTVPHGRETVFKLDNSGGTLTDLSSYIDSCTLTEDVDTPGTTTFGTSSKTYIVGLQDNKFSIGGPWDPTLDAHMNGVIGQTASLSFEYGPEGSDSGDRKYTGECYVTSYKPDSSIGDATKWTADLQVTGDVTRGTYS